MKKIEILGTVLLVLSMCYSFALTIAYCFDGKHGLGLLMLIPGNGFFCLCHGLLSHLF